VSWSMRPRQSSMILRGAAGRSSCASHVLTVGVDPAFSPAGQADPNATVGSALLTELPLDFFGFRSCELSRPGVEILRAG
jgi:hypothetical protein